MLNTGVCLFQLSRHAHHRVIIITPVNVIVTTIFIIVHYHLQVTIHFRQDHYQTVLVILENNVNIITIMLLLPL